MKACVVILSVLGPLVVVSCSFQEGAEEDGNRLELPLTEGTNMGVALSPDKRMLALDLQGIIWTMPAGGGTAVPITEAGDDCHEPSWAPDGRRLAFHCYRDGYFDIWRVDRDGSNLEQVTDGTHDDREARWGPAGGEVVFSSDRSGNYDLWKVDVQSKEVTQLTSHESADYHPSISPDGRRIAFVSDRPNSGIYVLDEAGLSLAAPYNGRAAAPAWQPDGEHLLFTGYDRRGPQLHRTPIEGRRTREVTDEDEDVFPFPVSWKNDSTYVYTADGKIKQRIIGSDQVDVIPFKANITVTKPDYRRRQRDFDRPGKRPVKGITGPVVSPDGQKVAFSALGDIYVRETGGRTRQITDDRHVDIDPDWSPDGKKLAFASDRRGRMEIWIRDLESGDTRLLTDRRATGAIAPSWSSDGTKIAFNTIRHRNLWGSSMLQVAAVSTGEVTPVHGPVFAPGKPSWSPDGEYIAMMVLRPSSSRYREGLNTFLIVSLEEGATRYVSPAPERSLGTRVKNGPIWSPDGRKMAYIRDGALWTVPVRRNGDISGSPRRIARDLAGKISWAADARHILSLGTDRLKRVDVQTGAAETIPLDLTWQRKIPDGEYLIHAGRLFDGIDSTYRKNMDILVRGNRVATVRPHQPHEESLRVVDASGKVVMPGLFDMHTHLHSAAGRKLGRLFLSYGITSIRETGADPYDARARKEAWASGKRLGPREFFTGPLIDGPRVYYGLANSVVRDHHLRFELERARSLGYDLLKTYVRMPDTLQKEVIDAAHAMGIPVSSHEIYPAARFGADAVEHLRGTSREGYSNKLSYRYNMYGDAVDIIAKSGMYVTPTIVMHGGYLRMAMDHPFLLDHPQMNACYEESYVRGYRERLRDLQKSGETPGRNFENLQQAVVDISRAGGRITAGTDVPFLPFGSSLHAELWLYVEAGLTPFQALQTATINAARSLGVARHLGSVERGKLADLVVVDGDPLRNIEESLQVDTVVKGGVTYTVSDILSGCR